MSLKKRQRRKKKLKIREDVDFNKISSEYNNISPNIIKQLIENDSFYFLPSNKIIHNNYKTRTNRSQNNKLKRPSSYDNNRNKNKLKKESEKNNEREIFKSINNEEVNNNFKSYSLNKNNMNLFPKRSYNSNEISKNNNYINEQNKIKKMKITKVTIKEKLLQKIILN